MRRRTIRIAGAFLCLALLSSMAVTPVAGQSDEERFLVELDAEGDALVSMTFVYDLDSEDEETAFEELRENATAQAAVSEHFENRMSAVVADSSAASDREMSVQNGSVEFRRDGDAGIVVLSIEWSNLAAVDGDRLTVAEPFASGFEPAQTFTVTAPDEYAIASVTPNPARSEESSATWNAGATLEDFEVVAEASTEETGDGGAIEGTETPEEDTTEDSPGFSVLTAGLALLSAALVAIRRRRR